MSVQQALTLYSSTGWEIVDEWDMEDGFGVRCPDCRDRMQMGYWPVPEDGVDGVHGVGCDQCQTVCPLPPPSERAARLGHGNDRVTVQTRSGDRIVVGVAHVDEDRSVCAGTDRAGGDANEH